MWVKLVLAPIKTRDGKLLLWQDNCESHCTPAIRYMMHELGVDEAFYPNNMTSILQVLDLVDNIPIKRHTRTLHAERIVEAFKQLCDNY
jgi:hypothetical protein